MLKLLEGYRMYISIYLLLAHQLLKVLGIDIFTDAQLSIFIDILLAILAALFRYLADKRWKKQLLTCIPTKENTNG